MRKLTLDLDALAVESFTAGKGWGAGTVKGHDSYEGDNSALFGSCVISCQAFCLMPASAEPCGGASHVQTCAYSCGQGPTRCAQTCAHTCDTGCGYMDTCDYQYCRTL